MAEAGQVNHNSQMVFNNPPIFYVQHIRLLIANYINTDLTEKLAFW